MTLVNKVKPNTYKITKDHPRLIIPFYDTTGKLFAFQGRAFGNEQPKYLTVKT
jgi:DNA primase